MKHITIPYRRRGWQKAAHSSLKKFNCIVVHRRAGKTEMAVNELLKRACQTPNGKYAYIAPTFPMVKQIAWDRLKFYSKYVNAKYNEAELRCTIPMTGSTIQLFSAYNADSFRGMGFNGVVIDETQDISRVLWEEVLLPTLFGQQDWFVIFLGTPKGKNFFYDIYQDSVFNTDGNWYSLLQTVADTGMDQTEDYKILSSKQPENKRRQEWFCDFRASVSGAYYADEIEILQQSGQIGGVAHDPSLEVRTAWDIGINDATSIWFYQVIGNQCRFIDYMEKSGKSIEWWCNHVIQYGAEKGYRYGTHFGPHDLDHREQSTGLTRQMFAARHGVKFEVLPKIPVADGIEAVRMMLSDCWFDQVNCRHGLDALINYQSRVDEKNETVSDTPLHNWASHGADAFRYAALSIQQTPEDRTITFGTMLGW